MFVLCLVLLSLHLVFHTLRNNPQDITLLKELTVQMLFKGVQNYIKDNQIWFFQFLMLCIFFVALAPYDNYIPAIIALILWMAFFCVFYLIDKKNFPVLKFMVGITFAIRWFFFSFVEGPWSMLFFIICLYGGFKFNNSSACLKLGEICDRVGLIQDNLDSHLRVEVNLVRILKNQVIVFVLLYFNLTVSFGIPLDTIFSEYPLFVFSVYSQLKSLMWVSYAAICILEIVLLLVFNHPHTPPRIKSHLRLQVLHV